jgi:hypothetical protein
MKSTPATRGRRFAALTGAGLIAASLLAACGGGVGSGGSGFTTSNGLAVGTVNGFGSIFVGGVRCDDTRAKVGYDSTAGGPETGTPDIKLGQSVEIVFDPASSSCKVLQALVDPELVGSVSSLAPLTVAGQMVLVNGDASLAPPTVFDGYADASGIKVGDRVEVHGRAVMAGSGYAIQASRIERKPATDVWVRAKGVISGLGASQFMLGGLTVRLGSATRLDPGSLVLANGQTVQVWSTAAVAADGSISASAVRRVQRSLDDQQAVRVEGPVSGCSSAPCPMPTLDGLSVDLGGASFVNGSAADVVNGASLRVEGRWDAANSRLRASTASVRSRDLTAGDITLIGAISDYISSSDFSVRGVPVTTTAATLLGAGCTLVPGQIVGVRGQVSTSQVTATAVDCLTLSDGITLDIFGGLLNVDAAAGTFNLSEGPYRSYTLSWDADTVFGAGLGASTLANGKHVGLRAVLTGGKLLVKRMILDAVPTVPAGVTQVFGNFGIAHDLSAGSVTVNKIQMNLVPGTTTMGGTVVEGSPVRTWFFRTGPLQPWTALQVNPVVWN